MVRVVPWLTAALNRTMERHTHADSAAGGARSEEIAMKTIVYAYLTLLVALSVIAGIVAGIAGSANALDAKSFYEQFDRSHYAKNYDWTAWGGAMRD